MTGKHCGKNGLDEFNMWKYKIGINNQIYKKIKLYYTIRNWSKTKFTKNIKNCARKCFLTKSKKFALVSDNQCKKKPI